MAKMATLPEQLKLSLTWDQGGEMANHARSPKPPAWRSTSATLTRPGSEARTRTPTGCCASTYPKARTSSFYGPGMLDNIAAELNTRPRKRHGFQTPAEVLNQLLSKAANNHGVA